MTKENYRFIVRGKLIKVYHKDQETIGFINSDGIVHILAEYIQEKCQHLNLRNFTRYYVSDVEFSEDILIEKFLVQTLVGKVISEYGDYHIEYSEYTIEDGFNNHLLIGNHNLLLELLGHVGKYLHLVIEKIPPNTKTKK